MRKVLAYLNPIAHLGDRRYSVVFPFLSTLVAATLLELYAYGVAKDPASVGLWAIFIFIALIIYFSAREGIRGGVITAGLTVVYYLYIVYSRHYHGLQLSSAYATITVLGAIYFLLALVIGWLKETVDTLIERETYEKRRLQRIIQQLPVGIIITDEKGKIVESNHITNQLLGIDVKPGFIVGQEKVLVKAKHNGKWVSSTQGPLSYTLASGKGMNNQEFVIPRKGGKQTYIQVNASTVVNKNNKVIAAVCVINDITHKKELEERKDDFVNMASHELKTPITSMKLYIESLMSRIKKTNDEQAVKTLSSIRKQTDRLQNLVNDLLDVSRLQTGKLTVNKEKFRLDKIIADTLDILKASSRNHKLVFTEREEVELYADRFRIYQVITNLVTNAIKYSPENTDIIVKLSKKDSTVVVSVQDFGMGIAKTQQKHIFERLYQVVTDKTKTFPGFGMGLYIAKEIVTRHKGKIWVESEEGKGSTFFISLPVGT